jgi:hypothetical protein
MGLEQEQGWLLRLVVMGAGVVFGGLFITALLIFGGIATHDSEIGPRDVFEAHLAALDAGDWELSDIYVKGECTIGFLAGAEDNPQEVLDETLASGFSFRRTFDVEEVWISEDSTEAILGLNTPSGLPSTAMLEKVEGEWLIAC